MACLRDIYDKSRAVAAAFFENAHRAPSRLSIHAVKVDRDSTHFAAEAVQATFFPPPLKEGQSFSLHSLPVQSQ